MIGARCSPRRLRKDKEASFLSIECRANLKAFVRSLVIYSLCGTFHIHLNPFQHPALSYRRPAFAGIQAGIRVFFSFERAQSWQAED